MNTPATRRDRVVLGLKENVALCNWLSADGNIRPGDTSESIATRARIELDNPRINKDHVYTRMAEFELKVPPSAQDQSDEQLLQDIRDLRQVMLAIGNMSPVFISNMDDMTRRAFQRLSARSGA